MIDAPSPEGLETDATRRDAASSAGARALTIWTWSVALMLIVGCALGWVRHVDDLNAENFVSGAWFAQANAVAADDPYPALEHAGHYAGTRYQVLPIALHGELTRLTGNPVLAGSLVNGLGFALMIAATWWLLGVLGCRGGWRLLLAAAPIATGVGRTAAQSIRHDALPISLQLVALGLMLEALAPRSGTVDRRRAMLAGLCCALAVTAKLSAVWALLAIVLWVVWRQPSRRAALVPFASTFAGVIVVAFVAAQAWTRGRYLQNMRALAFGHEDALLGGPRKLVDLLHASAPAAIVWIGVATVLTLVMVRRAQFELIAIAFACCALVTLDVLADRGAAANHLLDLVVLGAVVCGAAVRGRQREQNGFAAAAPDWLATGVICLVTAAVTIGLVAGADQIVGTMRNDGGGQIAALRALVPPDADRLLTDDPIIPALVPQRPVVADAFAFRRLAVAHPDWSRAVARRVQRHEFDVIVLQDPLDASGSFYGDVHFTHEIALAIGENYRFDRTVAGRYVYVPAS